MEIKEWKQQMLEQEQLDRLERYRRLNSAARKGQIVFTGSSLMQFFPVQELLASMRLPFCVYNRGITGYVSSQMLEHIDVQILDLSPAKLFINIGTNDIGRGIAEELWQNYPKILETVRRILPDCTIYIMAYYPCNDLDHFGLSEEEHRNRFAYRTPESLQKANRHLAAMAETYGCRYVNVNEGLYDQRGRLKREYCVDGVHLYPDGYIPILKNLIPYLEE